MTVEITISSTGQSAITQGGKMGKYELVPTLSSNSKPVYKQKNGDNYIYQHGKGRGQSRNKSAIKERERERKLYFKPSINEDITGLTQCQSIPVSL